MKSGRKYWVVAQTRNGQVEFLQKAGLWLPAEETPAGPRVPAVATWFTDPSHAIRTVQELGLRDAVRIVEVEP